MGSYYLNGQRITKSYAGKLLGNCYCMPQDRALRQFESLARNYFCLQPLSFGYQDSVTGIIYSNDRTTRAPRTSRRY